jgi:hypothetical protein
MGINGLWDIVNEHGCGKMIQLSDLYDVVKVDGKCCIAIDAYVIFYKYFCPMWKHSVEGSSFNYETIITNCANKIDAMCANLTSNRIEFLWCLDGAHNNDKLATERRIDKRDSKVTEIAEMHQSCAALCEQDPTNTIAEQSVLARYDFLRKYWTDNEPDMNINLSSKITDMKKTLSKYPVLTYNTRQAICLELKKRGHKFFSVPEISEGEKLCSIAVKMGLCQAALSNDSDLIPMGTRCIIKGIDGGMASVFTYNDIITKLKMTYTQLVSLCIMLGNDFNNGIVGMGKVKCSAEVRTSGFDIYEFDRSHCGILRTSVCIKAFTISRYEYDLVQRAVVEQLMSN